MRGRPLVGQHCYCSLQILIPVLIINTNAQGHNQGEAKGLIAEISCF